MAQRKVTQVYLQFVDDEGIQRSMLIPDEVLLKMQAEDLAPDILVPDLPPRSNRAYTRVDIHLVFQGEIMVT